MNTERKRLFDQAVRSRAIDFDHLIILAHAVLETGWFDHVVGLNNYWGMKAPSDWKGLVCRKPTMEIFTDAKKAVDFINARKADIIEVRIGGWRGDPVVKTDEEGQIWVLSYFTIKVFENFADWATPEGAVDQYLSRLVRLFPKAFEAKDNPSDFVSGLLAGPFRWATDPDYAAKFLAVYAKLKAMQEDSGDVV